MAHDLCVGQLNTANNLTCRLAAVALTARIFDEHFTLTLVLIVVLVAGLHLQLFKNNS